VNVTLEAGTGTLSAAGLELVVDTGAGARILSFSYDGVNVLTGPAANALFFGSTLWTAPESDWADDPFVPPEVLDVDPYTASIDGEQLVAISGAFTVDTKQLLAEKRFSYDAASGAILIRYSLVNAGAQAFEIAPWEVTRVPPDGLAFYPTGTESMTLYGDLVMQEMAGHQWMDHSAFVGGEISKTGGDAGAGWVAYVVPDAGGDLLFVKAFTDIAATAPAPDHSEIELFAQMDRSYVEVEVHGAYVTVDPGARLDWEVRWYLTRLPMGTPRMVGATELTQAVAALLP
jgi:hypothetical protein